MSYLESVPDTFPPEIRLMYCTIIFSFEEAKLTNDFSWFAEKSRGFREVCFLANIDYKRILRALEGKRDNKLWQKGNRKMKVDFCSGRIESYQEDFTYKIDSDIAEAYY